MLQLHQFKYVWLMVADWLHVSIILIQLKIYVVLSLSKDMLNINCIIVCIFGNFFSLNSFIYCSSTAHGHNMQHKHSLCSPHSLAKNCPMALTPLKLPNYKMRPSYNDYSSSIMATAAKTKHYWLHLQHLHLYIIIIFN